MSHKDCGLDYSPMSQMVCTHVKKLANEIDVSADNSVQNGWSKVEIDTDQRNG